MRGVSTVLDVTVFLLLVSVAAVALAVPAADPPDATADETAAALATTTTNVSWAPALDGGERGPTRTASGTHAGLLGRAAFANLTLDGEPLAPTTDRFRGRVRRATGTVLDWAPARTGVVAVWEPYPGAPIQGRVAAGARPPPGVEVSTATLTVPAPTTAVEPTLGGSLPTRYEPLARNIARTVLDASLAGDGDRPAAATHSSARDSRLRAFARALDVPVRDGGDGWRRRARSRIQERLADRLAADLRRQHDSIGAAVEAVETGTVRVVVREWSP